MKINPELDYRADTKKENGWAIIQLRPGYGYAAKMANQAFIFSCNTYRWAACFLYQEYIKLAY